MFKMKYNLFFYFIGFLILVFSSQFVEDLKSDRNYQKNIYARCVEIQELLNEDINKCL
tara:strand:+ start:192 stop:365 length:174 start_codon:yes stop_codon:yes gene_type:complete